MTLVLRATESADLHFVLAAEADPGAAPFIVRWSREAHELALADRDQAHRSYSPRGSPSASCFLPACPALTERSSCAGS